MIEIELKRIADSLEKLVGILGNPQKVSGDAQPAVVRVPNATAKNSTAEAPSDTAAAQAAASPAVLAGEVKTMRSRADIKLALDNLGVSYNDRLRTENLEALLIEAEKNGGAVKPADVQADFFGDTPPATAPKAAAKVYTVPEAIEIGKRLAAKFGPDKTLTIIGSYQCTKISEIAEKGQLQDFVTKVLAKEKEYETVKK